MTPSPRRRRIDSIVGETGFGSLVTSGGQGGRGDHRVAPTGGDGIGVSLIDNRVYFVLLSAHTSKQRAEIQVQLYTKVVVVHSAVISSRIDGQFVAIVGGHLWNAHVGRESTHLVILITIRCHGQRSMICC